MYQIKEKINYDLILTESLIFSDCRSMRSYSNSSESEISDYDSSYWDSSDND